MNRALSKDGLFLTKFTYMLDCVFQSFCTELLSEAKGSRDPLGRAEKRLANYQVDQIKGELRSFNIVGSIPPLSLPTIIEEIEARKRSPEAGESKKGRGENGPKRPPESKGGEGKVFPTRNPHPVTAWKIPAGKTYKDYFGPIHKERISGFPKVPHHNPTRPNKGPTRICLSWHADGQCGRGGTCHHSHLDASKMTAEAKEEIHKLFLAIYV